MHGPYKSGQSRFRRTCRLLNRPGFGLEIWLSPNALTSQQVSERREELFEVAIATMSWLGLGPVALEAGVLSATRKFVRRFLKAPRNCSAPALPRRQRLAPEMFYGDAFPFFLPLSYGFGGTTERNKKVVNRAREKCPDLVADLSKT